MRDLPNLGDKNKEAPLCYPYSIKARALIHAHLSRLELPRLTLKAGKTARISQGFHMLKKKLASVSTDWQTRKLVSCFHSLFCNEVFKTFGETF